MKKIVRLLSLVLLAALLFSVTGGSAFAANGAVPISDDDKLSVSVKFDSLTADDEKAYKESITPPPAPSSPAADIIVDSAGGSDEGGPDGSGDFDDDDLDKGSPIEGGGSGESSGNGEGDGNGNSGWTPTPVLPKCKITVVSGGDETELAEGGQFPFPALFSDGMELRIAPPADYYVSGLILANETESVSANSLLRAAYATSGTSAALSLKFAELKASGEGLLLDGSWLSSAGPDESYTLYVTCNAIEETFKPVIEYRAGSVTVPDGTVLVEGGNTFTADRHDVLYPLTSVLASAYQQGKEFKGYLMSYESGPRVFVSENDTLKPFGNVVLTAQWKDIGVLPHFTITADSNTQAEFSGSPLKLGTYTVTPNPADYHYNLSDVVTEGEVTYPDEGEKENKIVSFKLTDPYGNEVTGQALSQMVDTVSGKLRVIPRNMTVSAVKCELATNGEEKIASQITTSDGRYVNGYHQEGLLSDIHELAGDFVTGRGKTTFKTEINNKLRVRVKGTNEDVTKYYNITKEDGLVTITDVSPDPDPTVHDVVVTLKSGTWTYDGKPHYQPDYEVSGLVDGDKISKVNFKSSAVITDVGTATNDIDTVVIVTKDDKPVPQEKYNVTSRPATLKVTSRNLTVTAISGSLTSNGGEIVASKLESPDHEYQYGYKAEGLASGHKLSGSFVQGKGTSGFQTWIDLNKLQVLDGSNIDVTSNYSIHTVDGYITINVNNNTSQQTKVYITITAKSGSFVYDGNPHTMNEYTVSGLVDGDKVDKVTFKTTSTITNVGTQANEIQSAVIKTAAGAAVDSSKYSITYVPGKLTVTKFPLTLTAVSDAKTYDGKALNNKSVKSTALANSDHKLSADYEVYDSNGNSIKNGPVDVGVYVKKVSNIKITSGATDVTSNYEITTEDGTLTIRTASGGTSANSVTNTAYYGNTYTIRSDAPYSEFQYLLIDGQKVSTDNYTVKEGSTVITLKASFIQGLKTGNHNYSIVSTSKQADGTFNVAKAPKTSDGTTSALWIILLAAAAIALAVAFFFLKNSPKRDKKKPAGGQNSKGSKGASGVKAAAAGTATGTAAQFGRQRVPQQKKPVSDTVMDFETFFGADADSRPQKEVEPDPTIDLVPNFRINLDDYRKPAQNMTAVTPNEAAAAQAAAETAGDPLSEAEIATKPEAAPLGPETVPGPESTVVHEPAAETSASDSAVSAESVPAEEPTPGNPVHSVDAASSSSADDAAPAAPSYVGRHESSAQNRDSAASSWYRPRTPDSYDR